MAKRKQQHAEHDNAERWLLTYADMITLLMAFFIMLYSMSQLDLRKFAAVAGSVRAELGGTGVLEGAKGVGTGSGSGIDMGMNGLAPSLGSEMAGQVCNDIRDEMRAANASDVLVSAEDGCVHIRLPGGSVYFEPGSAVLTARARQVLNRLAPSIRKYQCHLRVEGHTCNLPLHSSTYASGWELSCARAVNAVFYLVRLRAAPAQRCSFMGYGERKPLVPNTSEANRRRNRRVEIIMQPLTSDEPTAQDDTVSSAATPPPVDIIKTARPAPSTEESP